MKRVMKRRLPSAARSAALALVLVMTCLMPARAQSPNRVYRLGHLAPTQDSEILTRDITLRELAKLGFVEGRNLVFDVRVGGPEALPGLMRELLAGQPDAIVAIGPALAIASAATRTLPILTFGPDPIELGLAASYARPGGNVTGVVILIAELEAKRLQLLQEAMPSGRRVAALFASAVTASSEIALRAAAAGAGLELLSFTVAAPQDYPAAFAAMRASGAQALVISAKPAFYQDAERLAALALEAGLPTACEWADMARAGCLLGYGPNRTALRQRMADQIARIFRGVAPGDIAIERPALFEFAINLKTARTLYLDLPAAIIARADEVIE